MPIAVPVQPGVPWLVRVIEVDVAGEPITLRFTMPLAMRPPADLLHRFTVRYAVALVNGASDPARAARAMRNRVRELAE